ncbi:hypothetical protein [Bifidobacterium imperatoris]|uniref:hypothetical protein n=1 Tax=Bifidobacterium imperatoris TaxID=2020965 RepID=UPI001F60ABD9|nr:hypothetical protein [Bifidobacterium imperatoris]
MFLLVLAPQVCTRAFVGGLAIAEVVEGLNLDDGLAIGSLGTLIAAVELPQAAMPVIVATASAAAKMRFTDFVTICFLLFREALLRAPLPLRCVVTPQNFWNRFQKPIVKLPSGT